MLFCFYSLEKTVKKYKNQIFEIETEANRSREELKSQMNQKHSQELTETLRTKGEEIQNLSKELEEALENIDNLKQNRHEELLLAENAKEQALVMAQHEQKSLSDRLNEALSDLESAQKDLEQHRLESNAKLEKDRCSISELQIEVSKLRGSLQDRHNQLDQAKSKLIERLEGEKQERLSAENEINVLKSSLKVVTDHEQQLTEQVADLKSKGDFLLEDKQKVLMELRATEKLLEEMQAKHDRAESMKSKLSQTVELLEQDKSQLYEQLEGFKSKLKTQEEVHYYAQEDLKTLNDKLQMEAQVLEEESRKWKNQCADHQRNLQAVCLEHEQVKDQLNADIEAEQRLAQQARLRISELESAQAILEKELSSLRALNSTDQESTRQKVASLNGAIEDIRSREKRLEDQRHDLEQQLSFAQQQIKDMNVQLNGKDGRLGELFNTIAKLEGAKKDLESKINHVASLLHHVRSSSNSRSSRPSTPTKPRRSSFSSSSEASNVTIPDFDLIKKDIRDLVAKIGQAGRERDEATHHLVNLKRQHCELIETNTDLEDKLLGQKKKSKSFEEQLKRLESKVVHNDLQLAEQVKQIFFQIALYFFFCSLFCCLINMYNYRKKNLRFVSRNFGSFLPS